MPAGVACRGAPVGGARRKSPPGQEPSPPHTHTHTITRWRHRYLQPGLVPVVPGVRRFRWLRAAGGGIRQGCGGAWVPPSACELARLTRGT